MKTLALMFLAATLAACAKPQPFDAPQATDDAPKVDAASPVDGAPSPATAASAPAPTADAPTPDSAYLGRWVGVEGMYLVVAPKPDGGVTMEMQWDLDHTGTFDGSLTPEGLRFTRDGVALTAVRSDGNATGLKYLAGKKNCLTVKSGEGYCLD